MLQKETAVVESFAEVLFLKEKRSTLLFPQRSALFLRLCFPLLFFIFKYEMKVFPRKPPARKNGREKSLCNEVKLSRNSSSVTETFQNCSGVPDFLIRQETV